MEKCENCIFFHELRKHGQVVGSVCTLFPQTETGYDAFAIVVGKEGMCEEFTPNKEKE